MEKLNKTWKISVIVLRSLLGFLFAFGSIVYFFKLFPEPEHTGNVKTMIDGFNASLYIMPIVKVVELICGISFLSGRYITLSNIVIFPISVNILCIHLFHLQEGLPVAAFVFISNLIMVYVYRDNYRTLLKAK